MFLTSQEVDQFNTPFIFTFTILISLNSITTSKNSTSLIFHLHFSSFIYKLFSTNLFTFSIILSYTSSSISIITLSIKLATFLVLIKFYRILFIIVWNIAGKSVSPKNITVDLKDLSRVINTIFYLSSFFIPTLL